MRREVLSIKKIIYINYWDIRYNDFFKAYFPKFLVFQFEKKSGMVHYLLVLERVSSNLCTLGLNVVLRTPIKIDLISSFFQMLFAVWKSFLLPLLKTSEKVWKLKKRSYWKMIDWRNFELNIVLLWSVHHFKRTFSVIQLLRFFKLDAFISNFCSTFQQFGRVVVE